MSSTVRSPVCARCRPLQPADPPLHAGKPITGRSHQIRVHLQFLGHSIANDPIYQNTAAWGEHGGKGGVFGAERGGSHEERQRRQDMGDMLMKQRKDAGVGADLTMPVPESTTPTSEGEGRTAALNAPTSIYNKQGRVRNAKPGQVDLDAVAADRKAHDPTLTESAKVAIAALRYVKDEADGWARQRDLLGIEAAKRCEDGGLLSAAQKVAAGEAEKREEEREAEVHEGGSNFCRTCFTPLIPDPRPEQLFIWLHAMRCESAARSPSPTSSALILPFPLTPCRQDGGLGLEQSGTAILGRGGVRCALDEHLGVMQALYQNVRRAEKSKPAKGRRKLRALRAEETTEE